MDADVKQPADPGAATSPDPDPQSPSDAIHAAESHFAELREYISYYLAVQIDRFQSALRREELFVAFGVLALIVAAGAIVTSIVLLLVGLAGAVGALFGRPWTGDLVVGAILVTALGIGAFVAYSRLIHGARNRTVKKYEHRQDQQREKFGTDVSKRAAETPE